MVTILRRAPGSPAKAMKVFQTPELMEDILLYLDTRDVLEAIQVTMAMRDTVNGSVKVQRSIGLLPNYDADFLALLWTDQNRKRADPYGAPPFHGFNYGDYAEKYCSSYDSRYDDIQMGLIPDPRKLKEADFRVYSKEVCSLYKLGSRCRSLSICEPPVKHMDIEINCDYCHEICDTTWRAGKLTPTNGAYVTLGDIYSATVKTRVAHRLECKRPKLKAGILVELRGSVMPWADDPIMQLRGQKEHAKKHDAFWRWDDVTDSEGDGNTDSEGGNITDGEGDDVTSNE